MVETAIPPQRNESAVGPDGTPTQRFAEYLEDLAGGSNEFELRITALELRVTLLEARMMALEARVTQNELDIAQNVVDIEFNRHYVYMAA